MDASPDVLAETVRAKRNAVDNDLELLRIRLHRVDPRRIDVMRYARTMVPYAKTVAPIVAGTAGVWLWYSRRRRVTSLRQLLIHRLTDLYQAEQQIAQALHRMQSQASDPELRRAFEHHRYETEGHIERLRRIFRSVAARPRRGRNAAFAAIIADGERLLAGKASRDVRDAWLIAVAQRVEHLEIAEYGTVRAYAEMLGYTFAAQLLRQTLEEERAADEKLTHLGERFVNARSIRADSSSQSA